MILLRAVLVILVWGLFQAVPAHADVFRPAYLEVQQRSEAPDRYHVLWKVPALDEKRVLSVTPSFPDGTRQMSAPTRRYWGGATTMHWEIEVPGGLARKTIRFDGRSQSTFSVLFRYRSAEGIEQVQRVSPSEQSVTIQPRAGPWEVMQSYTWIGVEHILGGIDHLLFVLALMLIVRDIRTLLLTVTSFTLAHSITLTLATLDVVRIPGPPVEAVIALSIVFVAAEILRSHRGQVGLAARTPWLVAFAFGLLHGLGFAGALSEVGLPRDAIPLALAFFNVGVELGQVAFIALVLLLTALAKKLEAVARTAPSVRTAVTYGIGGIASFWFFERVAAF